MQVTITIDARVTDDTDLVLLKDRVNQAIGKIVNSERSDEGMQAVEDINITDNSHKTIGVPAGRIVIRDGKTCGLYAPLTEGVIAPGLYEIQKVMGELQVVRIGKPNLYKERLNGLSVGELVQNPSALMTTDELAKTTR